MSLPGVLLEWQWKRARANGAARERERERERERRKKDKKERWKGGCSFVAPAWKPPTPGVATLPVVTGDANISGRTLGFIRSANKLRASEQFSFPSIFSFFLSFFFFFFFSFWRDTCTWSFFLSGRLLIAVSFRGLIAASVRWRDLFFSRVVQYVSFVKFHVSLLRSFVVGKRWWNLITWRIVLQINLKRDDLYSIYIRKYLSREVDFSRTFSRLYTIKSSLKIRIW